MKVDPDAYNAGISAVIAEARRLNSMIARPGGGWAGGVHDAFDALITNAQAMLIPPAGDASAAVAPLPLAPAPAGEGVAG